MSKHRIARDAIVVLAVAAAAVLGPTPAAAHTTTVAYRPPLEFADPATPRIHPPVRTNRGTVAALLSDRDLERFDFELAQRAPAQSRRAIPRRARAGSNLPMSA